MRVSVVRALGMLWLCGASTLASAETPFERQVLAALNAARSDPNAYARGLGGYRTYFHANLLRYPGQPDDIETAEGAAVVDETIAFLGRQAAVTTVQPSAVLAESAADLVADQAQTGDTGHDSNDGSTPADRARKRGGGAYVAEVIAYGPIDADDVIRQLIVDDGVPDRGHRNILFSPELRFAGVACGPHPEYRMMCVIDLGVTPDGHASIRETHIAAR